MFVKLVLLYIYDVRKYLIFRKLDTCIDWILLKEGGNKNYKKDDIEKIINRMNYYDSYNNHDIRLEYITKIQDLETTTISGDISKLYIVDHRYIFIHLLNAVQHLVALKILNTGEILVTYENEDYMLGKLWPQVIKVLIQ